MDVLEAIAARHSVRRYTSKPIEGDVLSALQQEIAACNAEGGLNIQLVLNQPDAFKGFLATYGMLRGVRNYLALVGPDDEHLEEKVGYYGERLVLHAQQLGLNTCWVGGTYRKNKCAHTCAPGEKLALVVVVGYGETQGRPRKSKTAQQVARLTGSEPEWFARGVEAALLAPTAVNQQKFELAFLGESEGGKPAVRLRNLGGPFSCVDAGIVKYHFEAAAGTENFAWA